MRTVTILILTVLFGTAFAGISCGQLVNSEWNAGSGNWNIATNWFPNDVPDNGGGITYAVQIGNRPVATNALVTLVPEDGTGDTITSLIMSNGADLATNNNSLSVTGQTTLDGAGSTIQVQPHATPGVFAFDTNDLDVNNGAAAVMVGGILNVDVLLEINAASNLQGYGTVNVGDADAVVEQAMENSGSIIVDSIVAGGVSLTLQTNGVDTIDLDGDSELGIVDVSNVSALVGVDTLALVVDAPLSDSFAGTLQIGQRDTATFNQNFTTAGATIEMNGGNNTATLNGAGNITSITSTAFTISGNAVIDNDMTFSGTANTIVMNASSTLTLNGSVIIPDASAIDLTAAGETLVIGGSLNIVETAGDFDWDNTTTIVNGTGFLQLAVDQIDLGNDVYNGTLNLDDNGDLTVLVTGTSWQMAGTMTKNNAGISGVAGDRIVVTGTMTVNAGTLDLPATTLSPGAGVTVAGTLVLGGGSELAGPTTLDGTGTLRMELGSTVTASTTVNTSTFDWDGLGVGSLHTINDGVVFTINSSTFDSDGDVDDNISLGGNDAQIVVNGVASWTTTRTLTTNPGDVGEAVIGGTARMVLSSANGLLNVDGNTTIVAPVTFGASSTTTIAAAGVLNLSGDATYDGATITGAGIFNPAFGSNDNVVVSNSVISVADFNFDRGNATWTIDPGATLVVNVTDYDFDTPAKDFSATMTINSGTLDVQTGAAEFVMTGALNLNNTTGTMARWVGEPLDVGNDAGVLDSDVNVGGTGISQITSQVDFNSDADVNIAAGATLELTNTVNFDTVNGVNNAEFTGGGTLSTSSVVNVNESVTINMTGGTVDLDGTDLVGNLVNVDAPLVINAATMASFGNVNVIGVNTLDVDALTVGHTGSLTVKLDSATAEWTLNPDGVMNIMSTNALLTLLQGSDVNLNGTVNVTGTAGTAAPVDIGGTVNLLTASPNGGLLFQGGTLADPNTLAGGTINGPGELQAVSNRALHGFGTINAPIDFDGTAQIAADNGTLTINNSILDAGFVGTRDADGILNVVNAWNSSVTETLRLNGGELTGGAVTIGNATGLVGSGLVSARVINNERIQATSSTLVVQTAGNDNDWDGVADSGVLAASGGGTLELRDNATFAYAGFISAVAGSTVFANLFELDFGATSNIDLSGSTYKSTETTHLGGAILVGAGPNSEFDIDAGETLDFETTSTTMLTGNLRLNTSNAVVRAGATFSGIGALNVVDGGGLFPANGANVNVLIDNDGNFGVAGAGVGRVDAKDFQQSATGEMQVGIGGTGLAQFDRLIIGGAAQLAGDLDLSLLDGFLPSLGQTFNIVSATAGVTGTFANVIQPVGLPVGLLFDVAYSPTLVQLMVVNQLAGDYNLNGVVDAADYTVWRDTLGQAVTAMSGADGDGDGLIDNDDYDVWKSNFGDTLLPGAGAGSGAGNTAGVPEPPSLVVVLAMFVTLFMARLSRAVAR